MISSRTKRIRPTLLTIGIFIFLIGLTLFLPIAGAFAATLSFTRTDFGGVRQPRSVAIGDLNGDGKPDLAVGNNAPDPDVSVFLNTGSGTFGSATNFSAGEGAFSVAIGDLNGDGKLDLAVANTSNNNVSILLGTGSTPLFTPATNFAVGSAPRYVAIGDLNGDGKPDLAVANQGSNTVSILLNTGTGSFGAATNFAVGTYPFSLAIGDLNGDGKPDLAVAYFYGSNYVSVLLNTGTGSFGAATNYTAGTNPLFVAIGDLNGDSKPDLAVANLDSNTISVLLNIGGGAFGPATNYAAGSGPLAVAIGDINSDGKLDLAVANLLSGNVSILLGNGDGTFGAATNFSVSDAWSIAIGDLNGDGKPDLAVANANSNTVSVLINTTVFNTAPPTLSTNNGAVAVNEGQTATNTGTFSDPDTGQNVTITASIGMVTRTGINSGTWSWSFGTNDGPAQSQTVTITASDGNGGVAKTTFNLTVNNVAPTATFNAPASVIETELISLSLTAVYDPSLADMLSLRYAFDCGTGSGFGTLGPQNTASCATTDVGTKIVKGKVQDKDGGFTDYTATVNIVAPPTPAFSINPPVPPGTCICTPLLMNTNSQGAEHLFFKANSSGTSALRLYAHSVNVMDPSNVVAKVFDTVTGLQVGPTLTASYPAGTAPGTEVSADGSYPTVAGRVYRVKVTTPNTPSTQPHYRIRFNGVVGAAINSPTFASIEPADTVRWFLNHDGGDLKVRVFSQGVPMPVAGGGTLTNGTGLTISAPIALTGTSTITAIIPGTFIVTLPAGVTGTAISGTATVIGSPVAFASGANVITVVGIGIFTITTTNAAETETVHVQIFGPAPFSPTAVPILDQTVNTTLPPGIDQVFTVPGAAAGQYRVHLTINHHYRLEKQGGADTAIYLGASTYGFGSLSGSIQTSSGAPFPDNVQVNLLRPDGTQEASTMTSTGSYTFSNLFVGQRRVQVVPPPGTNLVSPSFFDVFVSCEQNTTVPPFILNRPPVVNLPSTTTLNEGSSVVIVTTTSDPDGNPLTYNWMLTGPGVLTPAGATATYSHNDGPATASVEVTVNDGFGGIAKATGLVQTLNIVPIVNAGADVITNEGSAFSSSGSFTDPGADTWTATVDYGDGSGVQALTLTDKTFNLNHAYTDNGTYTVTVIVKDDDGGAGSDTTVVTVNNVAPKVNAGADQSLLFGNLVNISAAFTDPGRDTWTYSIDWGDGSPAATGSATVGSPITGSHQYVIVGNQTITVCVIDDDLGKGCDSLTVTFGSGIGKITGGVLRFGNNGRGGFNVQSNDGVTVKGELEYQNGTVNLHAKTMTAIAVSPDWKQGWFAGILDDSSKFTAYVEDNGEPGTNDIFKLWVDGVLQNGDGKLTGGNIQIHKS